MCSGFGKYRADYAFIALWYVFGPKEMIETTTTITAVVIRLNVPTLRTEVGTVGRREFLEIRLLVATNL